MTQLRWAVLIIVAGLAVTPRTAGAWELRNVAEDPRYARELRDLMAVLQKWMEQSDDFPAAFRVRDDNTDRITGLPFTSRIPALRNTDVPPAYDDRWGQPGPT